jgi:hypothetical protein
MCSWRVLLTKHQRLNNNFHTGEKLISAPYPAGHLSPKARWENVQLNGQSAEKSCARCAAADIACGANSRAAKKVVGQEQIWIGVRASLFALLGNEPHGGAGAPPTRCAACDLEHARCLCMDPVLSFLQRARDLHLQQHHAPTMTFTNATILLRVHNQSLFIDDVTRAVNMKAKVFSILNINNVCYK